MKSYLAGGILFLLVLGGAIGAIGVSTTHVVLEHQTVTQLLWNDKTAYLMVGMRRDGWTGSQAEYWWRGLKGLLGSSFQFNESRTWLVMTTIESSRVSRVIQEDERFRSMRPFEGSVYTISGPIKKWTGHRLESVPEADAARFKASTFTTEPSFSNVDGWSSRINLLNQGDRRFEYPLELDKRKVIVVVDRTDHWHPILTIQHNEAGTIEVISVDERFRRVSADDYDVLMHKPLKH